MVASPGGVNRVYRGTPINKRTAKRLAHSAALVSIAVLALLMGSTTAVAQPEKVVTVAIRDPYFEPSRLIVEPETTVR